MRLELKTTSLSLNGSHFSVFNSHLLIVFIFGSYFSIFFISMDRDLITGGSEEITNSRKPVRVRGTPTGYRRKTFVNEIDQDKEIPLKHCAVCCRLLYKEECAVLLKSHREIIEKRFTQDRRSALAQGFSQQRLESMTWPLLNYRDHEGVRIRELDIAENGKHAGGVVVCPRHKSGGSQDLETIMRFVR